MSREGCGALSWASRCTVTLAAVRRPPLSQGMSETGSTHRHLEKVVYIQIRPSDEILFPVSWEGPYACFPYS